MSNRIQTGARARAVALSLAVAAAMVTPGAADEPRYEMTQYQFVLLHAGPETAPLPDGEAAQKQEEHLDFLQRLIDEESAVIVGPVHDAGRFRGVVVLDVGTVEKAREVLAGDPWIASGRLEAEIHPWWAAKGILQKPANIREHRPAFLGLLKRPADAPDLPEEKLQELQAGHMANIQAMADSGDLVIAGPMGDDGVLRGIFVFRTGSRDRVVEMVAQDPSIQARRLDMDLYRWTVPRDAFPQP